jgi:hypothetical protein
VVIVANAHLPAFPLSVVLVCAFVSAFTLLHAGTEQRLLAAVDDEEGGADDVAVKPKGKSRPAKRSAGGGAAVGGVSGAPHKRARTGSVDDTVAVAMPSSALAPVVAMDAQSTAKAKLQLALFCDALLRHWQGTMPGDAPADVAEHAQDAVKAFGAGHRLDASDLARCVWLRELLLVVRTKGERRRRSSS